MELLTFSSFSGFELLYCQNFRFLPLPFFLILFPFLPRSIPSYWHWDRPFSRSSSFPSSAFCILSFFILPPNNWVAYFLFVLYDFETPHNCDPSGHTFAMDGLEDSLRSMRATNTKPLLMDRTWKCPIGCLSIQRTLSTSLGYSESPHNCDPYGLTFAIYWLVHRTRWLQ